MKPRSLRMRLTLWCVVVFTLIISVAEVIIYVRLKDIRSQELDAVLLSRAVREVADLQTSPQVDVVQIDDRAFSNPRYVLQMVQVEDEHQRVIAQSAQLKTRQPLLTTEQLGAVLSGQELVTTSWHQDEAFRIAALSTQKDGTKYAIAVAVPTAALDREEQRIALALILVGILAVTAASWGGDRIIDRALAPVNRITQRAREIGRGNLTQRIEVGDAGAEIVTLADVLNEMLEKLERLFESQRKFTTDASHEIRSPLAALRCRLEVAARQPRTTEQYQEVITSSLREVNRLSRLADDLLLLTRADADRLPLELREISVENLLRDVCASMGPLAAQEGVSLHVQAIAPRSVYADRTQLERVFRNLIGNGIKYRDHSGPGSVCIRVSEDDQWVRIDVADDGVGIPASELKNIFHRFYRTDHAHQAEREGTGLGLAICHQVIKAHGGRIEVTSQVGQGSTFSVFLPDAAKITSEEEASSADL